MANKSVIQFRVHELQPKADFRSVIRGVNYDSKYYLNDKDSPAEDTFDYSGIADPTKFYSSCAPDTIIYSLDIVWNGSQWLPYNGATPQYPPLTTLLPECTSSPERDYRRQFLIGRTTKFFGLRWAFTQLGIYGGYALCMSATDAWGRPYYINSNTHLVTDCTSTSDTTRNVLNGTYPSNCHLAGRAGDQTWSSPTYWGLGLGNFYDPGQISNKGELRAWQACAQVPNQGLYYWILTDSVFMKAPNTSDPGTRRQARQSSITLL